MTLARSVPAILAIVLLLIAYLGNPSTAVAQSSCAGTSIDMSTTTGSWSSASCHSPNRPIDPEGPGDGIYYAVYYDIFVPQTSEVTITLESSTDTFLYLLTGAGRNGEILARNDDIDYDAGILNSRITYTLEPNDYSIEVSTYAREATGEFTLTIDGIDFVTLGDDGDRAALIALYNATDGDNWTDNTNWLTDVPLSEWYGVLTNEAGRVEELLLQENQLTGQIPAELARLDKLIYIFFENNRLTGEIPSELGKLEMLKGLILSNNQLTGTIPSELANPDYLVYLELGNNRLTGTIPANLSNATHLRTLNLNNNQLTGTIPPWLGNLALLESLNLQGNQFTGELPGELTLLGNLDTLFFSSNAGLCAPTDAAFQTWLQSITNSNGDLCEEDATPTPEPTPPPPPATTECSEHISNFATYGRTLTSDCTSENRTAFGDHYASHFTFTLTHSTTVEVLLRSQYIDTYIFLIDDEGETIVDIDDYIGRNAGFRKALQPGAYTVEVTTYRNANTGDFDITFRRPEFEALKALYESAGGADWARKDNWLSNAPLSEWQGVQTDSEGRVTIVNLLANNLTGKIPSELQDLTYLEGLYLGRNNLSGAIPRELGSLSALQVLLLSDNELNGRIPAQLGNLENLRELYLSRNQLSGPIPATLGRLDKLYRLHMAANELSGSIPRDLGNLSSLRQLSMSDNRLTGSIPPQLATLDKLTHLYLWGNELTSGGFFLRLGDMDSLRFLDIGGNRIAGAQMLPELHKLDNLTGIGLHDSELVNSDLLDYMDELQALDLEFLNLRSNDLSDPRILVGLSRITTIQRLAINDNDFSGQLPRSMTALTLMRIFYFHDNKGICAPADAEFQNWLINIRDVNGPNCTAAAPTGARAPLVSKALADSSTLPARSRLSVDIASDAHSLSLLESIQPDN